LLVSSMQTKEMVACCQSPGTTALEMNDVIRRCGQQTSTRWFTQLPEPWHQVNERGHALAERLRQASPEVVAQGEQVVGQVHAVVVLDGGQVRELQQVLPVGGRKRRKPFTPQELRVGARLRVGRWKLPHLWYVGTTS